jgi:hypothetical protein
VASLEPKAVSPTNALVTKSRAGNVNTVSFLMDSLLSKNGVPVQVVSVEEEEP